MARLSDISGMTLTAPPNRVAVNDQLLALYSKYYDVDGFETRKRTLAAEDSVAAVALLVKNQALGEVVDVGAGDGGVGAGLLNRGLATAVDAFEISIGGLEAISRRDLPMLKARLFDGYRIPVADKSFDMAICAHVVEHVEHERLFLAEIARVSRRAIVIVPLEGGYRGKADVGGEHLNLYSPLTFRNLLTTSGMRPVGEMIYSSSASYERHLYGNFRGWIRNVIRRSLLRLVPGLAPHLMVYVMAVLCDCGEAK